MTMWQPYANSSDMDHRCKIGFNDAVTATWLSSTSLSCPLSWTEDGIDTLCLNVKQWY